VDYPFHGVEVDIVAPPPAAAVPDMTRDERAERVDSRNQKRRDGFNGWRRLQAPFRWPCAARAFSLASGDMWESEHFH
jgi:hypothetical protein